MGMCPRCRKQICLWQLVVSVVLINPYSHHYKPAPSSHPQPKHTHTHTHTHCYTQCKKIMNPWKYHSTVQVTFIIFQFMVLPHCYCHCGNYCDCDYEKKTNKKYLIKPLHCILSPEQTKLVTIFQHIEYSATTEAHISLTLWRRTWLA